MDFVVSLIIAGCSFLLGWMSCSGLYFMKSTRITATVMKMSYVFYLTIINKGLEYLHYAHINRLEALRKNDKSYGDEEYEAEPDENQPVSYGPGPHGGTSQGDEEENSRGLARRLCAPVVSPRGQQVVSRAHGLTSSP